MSLLPKAFFFSDIVSRLSCELNTLQMGHQIHKLSLVIKNKISCFINIIPLHVGHHQTCFIWTKVFRLFQLILFRLFSDWSATRKHSYLLFIKSSIKFLSLVCEYCV